MGEEIRQTVKSKRLLSLIAILAAFAVFATVGSQWKEARAQETASTDAAMTVNNDSLTAPNIDAGQTTQSEQAYSSQRAVTALETASTSSLDAIINGHPPQISSVEVPGGRSTFNNTPTVGVSTQMEAANAFTNIVGGSSASALQTSAIIDENALEQKVAFMAADTTTIQSGIITSTDSAHAGLTSGSMPSLAEATQAFSGQNSSQSALLTLGTLLLTVMVTVTLTSYSLKKADAFGVDSSFTQKWRISKRFGGPKERRTFNPFAGNRTRNYTVRHDEGSDSDAATSQARSGTGGADSADPFSSA